MPEAALEIVRAYVRHSTLVVAPLDRPQAGAPGRPERDAGGQVVDDEVSVRDGRRVAARFREIEVEAAGDKPG